MSIDVGITITIWFMKLINGWKLLKVIVYLTLKFLKGRGEGGAIEQGGSTF